MVAGDVYERAIPPTESVALLRDTLDRLVSRRVKVVAITGNHDGPERVAAYDGLTDLAGVIVRGGYARAGEVTTLESRRRPPRRRGRALPRSGADPARVGGSSRRLGPAVRRGAVRA